MEGIGAQLRKARLRWNLTLREVQERSYKLASHWGNPAYKISASWLDRVERQEGSLSAVKLIVLVVVYSLGAEEMLALCPPTAGAIEPESLSGPNKTLLLSRGPLKDFAKSWLPEKPDADNPPEETMLLPTEAGAIPVHYRRGIVGRRDRTLEPMVPAGSMVLINTLKRAIASRKQWNHEFDRPIYFLLTRNGYVLGFCELDRDAEWLTVVPHALSHESNRRWRYRKEIEVIGTITAIFMRRPS